MNLFRRRGDHVKKLRPDREHDKRESEDSDGLSASQILSKRPNAEIIEAWRVVNERCEIAFRLPGKTEWSHVETQLRKEYPWPNASMMHNG